jgi:Integrase core domain
MSQVLHGSATTTEAIRRAIQNSQASLGALSRRYGINQKTVAKWKKRTSVADLPPDRRNRSRRCCRSKMKRSSSPSASTRFFPSMTSRLPEVEGDKPARMKFKTYPIGHFYIDIAEVQTAEGKLYFYVAIDRTSKFAFVQLVRKTGRTSASAFLVPLIAAVLYKIHTVLTDNGVQFTFRHDTPMGRRRIM